MTDVIDARTTRFDAQQAWQLLKGAGSISVAKGKKVQTFVATVDEKEAILQQVMGPSGNLRAPTYRRQDQFLVGFNAELYEEWLK